MVKKISVSLSNFVYDSIISSMKGNRSEQIEALIQKGALVEIGDIETKQQQILLAIQEIREKDQEIKKLSATVGRLKKLVKPNPILERLQLVKDHKACCQCKQDLSEDDVLIEVPDGLIHEKCFLMADSDTRMKWKEGQQVLDWSLLDDEINL